MDRMRSGSGRSVGRQPDGDTEPLARAPSTQPLGAFPAGPLGRLAGGGIADVLATFGAAAQPPTPGPGVGGDDVGAPATTFPFPGVFPPGPAAPQVPTVDVATPIGDRFRPPFERFPPDRITPIRPFPLPFPISKTATQLASSAIAQLGEASPDVVRESLHTISIKRDDARGSTLRPDGLLDYLERKVRVGEVLNQLAHTWAQTTVTDFAGAFQMDPPKTDVMDAIVSIAILNNPELDDEILAENLPQATTEELLDNRVILDQWPKGGTVMTPPYVILVAVEYRSIAQAEDVVRSITGELTEFEGAKLPRVAVQKLQG